MSYHWPILDRYGVGSIRDLALMFAQKMWEKPLGTVLREQKILFVDPGITLLAGLDPLPSGLVVAVGLRRMAEIDKEASPDGVVFEALISFAHEVGHSLGYSTFENHEVRRSWDWPDSDENFRPAFEEFAETFAYAWLTDPRTRNEVDDFLRACAKAPKIKISYPTTRGKEGVPCERDVVVVSAVLPA